MLQTICKVKNLNLKIKFVIETNFKLKLKQFNLNFQLKLYCLKILINLILFCRFKFKA